MKRLVSYSTTPLVSIIIACVAIIAAFAISISSQANAADSTDPSKGRLVTIHDRGIEKVVLTRADTIEAAVKDAGLTLDPTDTVEPARDEKLVARDYQVNIYRARPVIVIDGATKLKVMTAYQSASDIAKAAGIELYDEDVAKVERVDDLVSEGASVKLTITRSTPINLVLYGKRTAIRTQATSVDKLLAAKNITLSSNDTISVARSSTIIPNMTIEIWRNGKQTVTEDKEVAFETEQIKDTSRELGFKEVKTVGENGSRSVTYEIEMRNGVEVARQEIQSVVTKEAKKQVEVIGAKLPTPTNPSEAQALGHQMMLAAGYGEDQWPCLYNLWMRESGWRTTAGNSSSGAYGIPQALPASKMSAYGADYLTNASVQISWGLNYIKGRYGSPCGAWDTFNSRSPHWY